MRALAFTRYGGPEALSLLDLPAPAADPGRVLIRTAAAGLNPVDVLQRSGTFKALAPYRFPKIAGNELSGTVEAIGPGVDAVAPGDGVIVRVDTAELGAFAELVSVAAEHVAPAPTSIPLVDAAGLPLAGLTAQQALGSEHLAVTARDRLLITGAAGGVGQIAVQLARIIGADITVTASPAGADLLRGLGADHVIDYRARRVSDGPERFTKVLDLVGGDGLEDLLGSVERGGRVVTLSGPPSPGSLADVAVPVRRPFAALAARLQSRGIRGRARAAGVSYEFFLMHPDGAGLAELARLVDAGRLTVPIDSRFALADHRDAFARLESRRAKGKVLVEF